MKPELVVIGAAGFSASRVFYAAGHYRHAPAGILQLRVVRRGSSYAEIDLGSGKRRVFTRPGDLLLSLPDRPTEFQIDDSRELTVIQARPEAMMAVLEPLGASLEDLRPLTERAFRQPVVAELCRNLEAVEDIAVDIGRLLLGAIVALLVLQVRAQRSAAPRHYLNPKRIDAVEQYIDRHLAETISVQQLAAVAQMQERSFAAAFREATGLPAYQYILRRRVERGAGLLVATAMPIAEIAQLVGFTHQAHFTRVMRRLMGATPAEVRARGAPARE